MGNRAYYSQYPKKLFRKFKEKYEDGELDELSKLLESHYDVNGICLEKYYDNILALLKESSKTSRDKELSEVIIYGQGRLVTTGYINYVSPRKVKEVSIFLDQNELDDRRNFGLAMISILDNIHRYKDREKLESEYKKDPKLNWGLNSQNIQELRNEINELRPEYGGLAYLFSKNNPNRISEYEAFRNELNEYYLGFVKLIAFYRKASIENKWVFISIA